MVQPSSDVVWNIVYNEDEINPIEALELITNSWPVDADRFWLLSYSWSVFLHLRSLDRG
jgi:hypothetical protein